LAVTSYKHGDIRAAIDTLRDTAQRQRMSEAASRLVTNHQPQTWMPWLIQELAACLRERRELSASRHSISPPRKMASEVA
jgi:hypothetical protein